MFDFFKNIFGESGKDNQPIINSKKPLIHEELSRNEQEKHGFERWKLEDAKDNMVRYILQQYKLHHQNANYDLNALLFLNTTNSKGFILRYKGISTTKSEFQYLFDYLREQILQHLYYKKYLSDIREFARKDYVETIERHYVKPRFLYDEEKQIVNQLYGNVIIEHTLYNQNPVEIKFMVNSYTDYKYTQVIPFNNLLEIILQ